MFTKGIVTENSPKDSNVIEGNEGLSGKALTRKREENKKR